MVRGTIIGLEAGEIGAIERRLRPIRLVRQSGWTILDFLRNTDVVHA
jgi:hypothetical protein